MLSQELGINTKIAAKWRKRATVEDLKTGPKAPHSTSLTEAEEAAVGALQRHTLLPLDDCLYALQPSIPHLTRSGGGHVAFAVGGMRRTSMFSAATKALVSASCVSKNTFGGMPYANRMDGA